MKQNLLAFARVEIHRLKGQIPLTPPLSQKERENHPRSVGESYAAGLSTGEVSCSLSLGERVRVRGISGQLQLRSQRVRCAPQSVLSKLTVEPVLHHD